MAHSPDASESTSDPRVLALAAQIKGMMSESPVCTISTAESCTGGNVAAAITAIPGSSDYFLGGIVSYSNKAKHALLGVPDEILNRRGAVSDACAIKMAEGARRRFESCVAVSTTGIAGPAGATARKPVGLVYIATAIKDQTAVYEYRFQGNRNEITRAATEAALVRLIEALESSGSARCDNTNGENV